MSDSALSSRSAFADLASFAKVAGITVEERSGLGLASVAVRKGRRAELQDTLRNAFGLTMTEGPHVFRSDGTSFVGIGPDNWLAVGEDGGWRFALQLGRTLQGIASVCDQSSAYGLLRLSGPNIRRVLAKGVPVDLHPDRFAPGDASATMASHLPILLWQIDDAPTYDLAVYRSYAASFCHWLESSCAEFGAAPAHDGTALSLR